MQLSSSEISLYSKDQKTLNASATRSEMDASGIVWESSDTSVAAVNGSGVVTAKNPGTATITCYGKNARGIRATCKVTVKLRQTTGVKLVSKAFNRIRISWKAVPGCNRYAIYRWDESGNSKKMATVTADVVTWQDTAVKTGSTYTYRIRLLMYVPERRLFMEPYLRRSQQKRSWGRPVQWLKLSADHVTGYPGRRFPEPVAIISTGSSRGKLGSDRNREQQSIVLAGHED